MFIFSIGFVPIGLGNYSYGKVVAPKLFSRTGEPWGMPTYRGRNGEIATKVYPEVQYQPETKDIPEIEYSPGTQDKYDFFTSYSEDESDSVRIAKDLIRRDWDKPIEGLIPVAIRYRWNIQGERISSAIMVTPDGKSKIEIDEDGTPVKIYFKPNSIVEQKCPGEQPLILKADIQFGQMPVISQDDEGGLSTFSILMFATPEITERFDSREIIRDPLKEDYGVVRGKWGRATDDMFDPRRYHDLDKRVLAKQISVFMNHYGEYGPEIRSRYKSEGSYAMN